MLSQLPGNATLVLFPGAPSGNCNSRQLALNQSNGSLYTCINAGATNQGTWQIVAGGGGGGGWNPPTVPGDTIFGNNTVGTSVPSFFIPGGDVSFSSGNFSVNSLHFGPNSFALTNTGIATGNCLQVSGGSIIGGACGTGGGGNLSGTGTVNLVPKFTAATALGNSLLSDNGTTLTYTGTGGIVAPKISITQGPLQFTSVEGALPALPGANNNMLVSGPDGWYVSNANSSFFKIEPPGTGGAGGAVTSVFTRTGAILAQNNDYSVSQVTGAAPLASPAFTGTPTAPAPTGTAATSPGTNQIATTAFVFANAGSGGLTGTGANNSFAKWTGASSLGGSFLTETGTTTPVLAYAGTGGIQALSPPANDNSNRVATTEWIQTNYGPSGGGGGGGTPVTSITQSAQAPKCAASADGVTTFDVPAVITANDTVVVFVQNRAVSVSNTISDDAASGGNSYTQQAYLAGSGSIYSRTVYAIQTAKAATTIHLTASAATRIGVCVATYVGVASLGPASTMTVSPAAPSGTFSITTQDANNLLVAYFAIAGFQANLSTFTIGPGTGSNLANAANPNGMSMWFCEHAQPVAQTLTECTITNSAGNGFYLSAGIELRCCAGSTGGGLLPGMPRVVAYKKANITVTTSATTDVAFFTCSVTNCPPGYYRVTWDFLSLGSGCTNGTVIVNIDYYDEYDLNTVQHTGIGSASAVGPGRNHAFWNRLQTVAKTIDSTTGISFSTSTTACSAGTGTAQQTVSVERLQ